MLHAGHPEICNRYGWCKAPTLGHKFHHQKSIQPKKTSKKHIWKFAIVCRPSEIIQKNVKKSKKISFNFRLPLKAQVYCKQCLCWLQFFARFGGPRRCAWDQKGRRWLLRCPGGPEHPKGANTACPGDVARGWEQKTGSDVASGAGRVNDILIVLLPAGIDLLDVLRHIFFGVFFQRFSCSHSRSIMINYSLQNLFVFLSHRSLVRHEFAPGYELLTRPSQRRWPWFPLQFESISFFVCYRLALR